ncbi:hypothetical protein RF11_05008 [Thelohanellus kitauei]|uniref:Uncharacterized protein n=1 Tax=Thelohanellus kitauei TaxID=669202 RepID=A0A0C2I9B0_THEKT|nr:hypothetical protein RF11_05008 [Thelohanellus kitauei]
MANRTDRQDQTDGDMIVCPGIRITGCSCLENRVKEAVWNGQKQSGPQVIKEKLKGMRIDAARLSKYPRLYEYQGMNDTNMPQRAQCCVMGTSDDSVSVNYTNQTDNLNYSFERNHDISTNIWPLSPVTIPYIHVFISRDSDSDDSSSASSSSSSSSSSSCSTDSGTSSNSSPLNNTGNNSLVANCLSPIYIQSESVAVDYSFQSDNWEDSFDEIPDSPTYIWPPSPATSPFIHNCNSSDSNSVHSTGSSDGLIISISTDSPQPNKTWNNSLEDNVFSPSYTESDSVSFDSTRRIDNWENSFDVIPDSPTYIWPMSPLTSPIIDDCISSDSEYDDSTCSTDGRIITNSTNSSQQNDTGNNSIETNSIRPACIQNNAIVAYHNDCHLPEYIPLNIGNIEAIDPSRKSSPRLVPNKRANTYKWKQIMKKNHINLYKAKSRKQTIRLNVSKTAAKNTKKGDTPCPPNYTVERRSPR